MIDLIFDILPQIHGGGDHQGIGAVKSLETFLTFIESLTTKGPAEIFAAFMPGFASLDNIHPLIVHFPIALFTLFFFADTIGGLLAKPAWRIFATPLLYIGTFTALLTVAAGFQAAYSAPHSDVTHAIMLRHQTFGLLVTILAFILSIRRYFAPYDFLSTRTYGHFALSTLLVILISFGADLGGFMVYQHGVAVTPVMESNALFMLEQPRHTHDYNYAPAAHHQHDDATAHSHEHKHDAAPQVNIYEVAMPAEIQHEHDAAPHAHTPGGHAHTH